MYMLDYLLLCSVICLVGLFPFFLIFVNDIAKHLHVVEKDLKLVHLSSACFRF